MSNKKAAVRCITARYLARRTAGVNADIAKTGKEYSQALLKLDRAAKKLQELFKKNPEDDYGRGKAAEALVAKVYKFTKGIWDSDPLIMGVYVGSPMDRE